jgi:hypothetical protein
MPLEAAHVSSKFTQNGSSLGTMRGKEAEVPLTPSYLPCLRVQPR